jgi:hypothetical protein
MNSLLLFEKFANRKRAQRTSLHLHPLMRIARLHIAVCWASPVAQAPRGHVWTAPIRK